MAEHLAIVLPGREYGSLGPALRLPRLAAEQAGARVVEVSYPAVPPETSWDSLYESVAGQIDAALAGGAADRVTFVAKSLGTAVLAGLPSGLPLPAAVDAVWLTPIFGREPVRAGAVAKGWPSLLVAGAADSLHEGRHHDAVAAALGARSVILPGADHLLEVPGDVMATLEGWRLLTESVVDFLG